jgi:endo-alpha-1,4-polygalactosaminidase (GH114 family)
MTNNIVPKKTTIYRFNFDDHVVDVLTEFAKTHEHDDAPSYKEAWKLWCDENQDVIRMETTRLTDIGYDGDVIDKMYKAGRYYFRTKKTIREPPKTRRNYISLDPTLIANIDAHISGNICGTDFTPASGFELFDKRASETIQLEIGRLVEDDDCNATKEELVAKIKKTYKNRYYILSRKEKEA